MNFDFDWGAKTPYVAGAFAVTALIIGWMILDSLLRARYWRRRLKTMEKDGA